MRLAASGFSPLISRAVSDFSRDYPNLTRRSVPEVQLPFELGSVDSYLIVSA